MPGDGDETFCAAAGDALAGLPGVQAVTLGGSRAAGTARPDSDWDFAVYYRSPGFDPLILRSLGWPGEIWQWVTNEKTLLDRAGLRSTDGVLVGLSSDPGHLLGAIDQAAALLRSPD